MADRVVVDGADTLAATLRRAAARLADTTTADQDAADTVRKAARPPVRTGHLARSAVVITTSTGAEVGWTAAYAAVINNGSAARHIRPRRFAEDAARTASWTDPYTQHVEDTLDLIHGD